jgi:hypothetical protein
VAECLLLEAAVLQLRCLLSSRRARCVGNEVEGVWWRMRPEQSAHLTVSSKDVGELEVGSLYVGVAPL